MKKSLIILLIFVLVVGAFFAGFKLISGNIDILNKKAVPDIVVYEYFSDYIDMDIEDIVNITHNYNSEVHIDNVTVDIRIEHEYGVQERTYILHYQYYSSNDLWELLDEKSTNRTYWDEEKLEDTWTGENENILWQVDIIDLDFINQKVTLSYSVRFLGRSYNNYGDVVGIVYDHNKTYDLSTLSEIYISKKDNSGITRNFTIDYDLTKGIVVYT